MLLEEESTSSTSACPPTSSPRPPSRHARQASSNCEKPMARSLEEADATMAAAKEAGVKLMIAHCIRFWPEYAFLKAAVDDGRYGKLLSVNFTRYGEFPLGRVTTGWPTRPSRVAASWTCTSTTPTSPSTCLASRTPWPVLVRWTAVARATPSRRSSSGLSIAHLEGGCNPPGGAPFKMAFRAVFEKAGMIWDAGPMTVYEDTKDCFVPEFPKMSAAGGGDYQRPGWHHVELAYFVDCVKNDKPIETVTPESSREPFRVCLAEIEEIKKRAANGLVASLGFPSGSNGKAGNGELIRELSSRVCHRKWQSIERDKVRCY